MMGCPRGSPEAKSNRKRAFSVGDAVPKPLGFTAFPPEWLVCLGRLAPPRHVACVTAFRPLGRRSGRIPALPYPPPR
jgi:hypothetical protein